MLKMFAWVTSLFSFSTIIICSMEGSQNSIPNSFQFLLDLNKSTYQACKQLNDSRQKTDLKLAQCTNAQQLKTVLEEYQKEAESIKIDVLPAFDSQLIEKEVGMYALRRLLSNPHISEQSWMALFYSLWKQGILNITWDGYHHYWQWYDHSRTKINSLEDIGKNLLL
jgi:hypothetical protein